MALRKTHPAKGGAGFAPKGNPGLGDGHKPDTDRAIAKAKRPVKRGMAKRSGRGR